MENNNLAKYAIKKSTGRRYPTDGDKFRNDFRRDIGRVLYSKAFRRLAFKTQVFSPSEGDHYRNRLTHTLETTQIARVVAEQLNLNAELAEVIALAHDLGHPPFGHQGEKILDELMNPYGGFDHNLQNLRIVMLLEVKTDKYPGLNLTYETLYGIAKSKRAKLFIDTLYGESEAGKIRSCEARVADIADDIAYTATDFDDYVRYHNFSLERLRGIDIHLVQSSIDEHIFDVRIAISALVRNIVSTLVTDLIENSLKNLAEKDGENTSHEEALDCIKLSDDVYADYKELSAYLNKNMYHDADLKAGAIEGASILRELFAIETERMEIEEGDPEGFLDVCDYVAGMTDRFTEEYIKRVKRYNGM